MSRARKCVGCGCKYYPASQYSYPSVWWNEPDHKEKQFMYARFHSKSCMEQWLSKNAQAFAELVDNITIYDNTITNQTIEKG
jgi:hypothetical protein